MFSKPANPPVGRKRGTSTLRVRATLRAIRSGDTDSWQCCVAIDIKVWPVLLFERVLLLIVGSGPVGSTATHGDRPAEPTAGADRPRLAGLSRPAGRLAMCMHGKKNFRTRSRAAHHRARRDQYNENTSPDDHVDGPVFEKIAKNGCRGYLRRSRRAT